MKSCLLYPPNSHLLTDSVINAVVVKSKRPSYVYDKDNNASTSEHLPDCTFKPTTSARSGLGPTKYQVRKNARNKLSITEKEALELHLQRRRVIQQRYRKNIEHKQRALVADVAKLQMEVQRIELILHPPPRVAPDTTSWKAVVEFVHLFRSVVAAPGEEELKDTTALKGVNQTQKQFLFTIMAPDIAFNNGYGIDRVLSHWHFCSLHFLKMEVRLVCLEHGSGNEMIAHLSNCTIITESMLRNSLFCDGKEGDNEWPSFAWKLLGQRLTVQTTVRFEWDDKNRRFESVFFEADMLTPLLKLLGDMEDASTVLSSNIGIY
ncbi:hypothetical protein AM587_10000334 [Phytophthora nicotianae]|uniref:BZIP transcription factor 1 n=1 Tax=Phytophthora nicotianae TaxID=4792 RepID=A0A0W8CVT4_PHYNI|nr:hypothetical protein AM587_10000334 [Phytophthora nicotianae]